MISCALDYFFIKHHWVQYKQFIEKYCDIHLRYYQQ